jgi:hypothetical protein
MPLLKGKVSARRIKRTQIGAVDRTLYLGCLMRSDACLILPVLRDDADPHLSRSARPLQPPNCPGLIVAAYAPLVFLEGELLDAGRTALFAIALTVVGTYTNVLGRPEKKYCVYTHRNCNCGRTNDKGSARAFHGHPRFPMPLPGLSDAPLK